MNAPLTIKRLTGRDRELQRYLPHLARLRIEVFRDFPYLYQGSDDYEERYLKTYTASPESVVVLALDGDRVVGASTGIPLAHEEAELRQPFVEHGFDTEKLFYRGESVLLTDYRGRGTYPRFFAEREGHARALGRLDWCCFCAGVRPDDYPRRPPKYRPLDPIWRRYGYAQQEQLVTTYTWQDLDEAAPSPKPMVFWLKSLKESV